MKKPLFPCPQNVRTGQTPFPLTANVFYGLRLTIIAQLLSSSRTLLRPSIRRFTTIISDWSLRTSSKLTGKKS